MPIWDIEGGIALQGRRHRHADLPFPVPCAGYVLRSMKLNATTIGGVDAILETDFNQTFTGLPLAITEHHIRSTTARSAPVPNGADRPPRWAPNCWTSCRPSWSRSPGFAPFVIATPVPSIPITFTLTSRISRAVDSHASASRPMARMPTSRTAILPARPSLLPVARGIHRLFVVVLTLSAAYLTVAWHRPSITSI